MSTTTSGQDDTLSAYRFSQDISRAASVDSARPSMQINRPPPKPEEQYTAYERAKKYIWNLTEQETHPTLLGRIFNIAIVSCIIISCLHLIYETEPEWVITDTRVLLGYQIFRLCYTILFCVEYFLRLWSCTASRHYTNYGAIRGRIRFFFSFRSLIDIFSILPSLVSLSLMSNDFMKTGVVHLTDTHASGLTFLRLLRFAKLGRKSKTIHRLKRLAINRRDDIYSCAVVVLMSWIIMSCLLYYAERDAQPEHFGSIISAMWFSAVTMTTIGYGDVTPKTGTYFST
jgi:voltage-gated potassium channel